MFCVLILNGTIFVQKQWLIGATFVICLFRKIRQITKTQNKIRQKLILIQGETLDFTDVWLNGGDLTRNLAIHRVKTAESIGLFGTNRINCGRNLQNCR